MIEERLFSCGLSQCGVVQAEVGLVWRSPSCVLWAQVVGTPRSKHVRKSPQLFDQTHKQDVPWRVCHCVFGCPSEIFFKKGTGCIVPPLSARDVDQLRARVREVWETAPSLPTTLIATSRWWPQGVDRGCRRMVLFVLQLWLCQLHWFIRSAVPARPAARVFA